MAIQTVCAKLFNGLDLSCINPARKYWQQMVLINQSDILKYTITPSDPDTKTCHYKVKFELKPGTTGYRILGPEGGSSFFGSFDKSRSDIGYAQYIHHVSFLIAGITEESKCILEALDKGSFVAALQLKDGTIEIYGIVNGLNTDDYTFSLQDGGGGTPIVISSSEDAPEGKLPLVYESAVPGQENEDFDDAFAVGS